MTTAQTTTVTATEATTWCRVCRTRVPDHLFAVARCISCTQGGHRTTAARLAFRYLVGHMATPARRRQIAYRILARSLERQAALEGIHTTIGPEPDFGVPPEETP